MVRLLHILFMIRKSTLLASRALQGACCGCQESGSWHENGMFLQVSYAAVGGPGVIMRILCFFCSIISFCSSLAAVGFIWVRPPMIASVEITY